MQVRVRKIAWIVGALVVLALAAAAAFVYFGIYNVAASKEHFPVTYRLMHYAMRQSVRAQAQGIQAPNLDDPARIRNGVVNFRKYCVQCHGAPGIAPNAEAIGMTPPPANLVEAAREWSAADLYWVARHGVKMTAMPAWEYKLSDTELWNVVALLKSLPQLSPQQYRDLEHEAIAMQQPAPTAAANRPGNAQAGRRAVTQYLCATCHRISGVAGAYNDVGPPLDGIARRQFIGGVLPNTQENMVRWLRNPPAVDPQTAMPALGLSEQDARDIAAFLYSLKEGPD
jgi:mono/diheme cytochrome c family protein